MNELVYLAEFTQNAFLQC